MPVRIDSNSSSTTYSASQPVLSQGASGSSVRSLQQALASAGFSPGGIDGSFGPGTRSAVVAFQRAHGLSADGVVGPRTWAALGSGGASSSSSSSSSSGSPTLKQGSSGSSVTQLQKLLSSAGFSCSADGSFGPATRSAVVSFQRAHGLSADGVVGSQTWAALRSGSTSSSSSASSFDGSQPTLKQGSNGSSVVQLQQLLSSRGYSPGAADGAFGPGTRAAVLAFQRANGLTADGVVGARTWAALKSGSSSSSSSTSSSSSSGSHPTLRSGSSGSAVVEMQRLLAKGGFSPGSVDGSFGPATLSALKAFQRNHGLSADGICGPRTWQALEGTSFDPDPRVSSGTLRQRILEVAQAEVGTIERTGHNDGAVLKYPNYFGRGSEPYCADFVSWVFSHAGQPLNYAYCPYLKNHLVETGKWKGKSNPQAGDIVLFDWDSDGVADHVGLVRGVNPDGSILTIEGNTENGSTGQSGVWNRTRSMSCIMGFGNP